MYFLLYFYPCLPSKTSRHAQWRHGTYARLDTPLDQVTPATSWAAKAMDHPPLAEAIHSSLVMRCWAAYNSCCIRTPYWVLVVCVSPGHGCWEQSPWLHWAESRVHIWCVSIIYWSASISFLILVFWYQGNKKQLHSLLFYSEKLLSTSRKCKEWFHRSPNFLLSHTTWRCLQNLRDMAIPYNIYSDLHVTMNIWCREGTSTKRDVLAMLDLILGTFSNYGTRTPHQHTNPGVFLH